MQLTRQEHKEMLDEIAKLSNQERTLRDALEAANKKIKEEESKSSNYYARAERVEKELAEAHSMLDVFPGSPGRQSQEEETYRRTTYSLATRLAGWMAGRMPTEKG